MCKVLPIAHRTQRGAIMENTIGEAIGIQIDNFSVKNDAGDTVKIRVKIDYSNMSDLDIMNCLNGNRRIPLQRVLRKMSKEEIADLDGTTFDANDVGKKIKSRSEKINEFITAFVNAGVDKEQAVVLATNAVDNPQLLTIKE